MNDDPKLSTVIHRTLDLANRCKQNETSDNFGLLGDEVDTLEAQAREAVQAKLALPTLLQRLKAEKPLSAADLKNLELLIVGDAEYFLKYETEFDRWKSEIQQLLAEVSNLQSDDLDIDGLMHLRALCNELRRVVPDVVYYLDQKERASKFQEATRGPIDADGYRVLVEIVEPMLLSEKM